MEIYLVLKEDCPLASILNSNHFKETYAFENKSDAEHVSSFYAKLHDMPHIIHTFELKKDHLVTIHSHHHHHHHHYVGVEYTYALKNKTVELKREKFINILPPTMRGCEMLSELSTSGPQMLSKLLNIMVIHLPKQVLSEIEMDETIKELDTTGGGKLGSLHKDNFLMNLKVIGLFMAAIGTAAVALAFTVLSSSVGVVIASAAFGLVGLGLFAAGAFSGQKQEGCCQGKNDESPEIITATSSL
jgi:hypothetical protein